MEKNSFLDKARAAIKSAVGDDIPDYLKEQQKIKEKEDSILIISSFTTTLYLLYLPSRCYFRRQKPI
jgi:hypothetical protein